MTSIYVWGNRREAVNKAAGRVAVRLDRKYLWVAAADPAQGRPPGVREGGQGPSVPGLELLPRPALSEERLWSYLKPNGQGHLGSDLLEFLRLPDPIQQAVAELLERPAPRVLALGNLDLVPDLPGADRSGWSGLIEYLRRHEVTLVVSTTGRPLPERIDFDYSIATPEVLPQAVRGIAAVCQWGNCRDCVVNRIFPWDEVICINRLPAARPLDGMGSNGFASH